MTIKNYVVRLFLLGTFSIFCWGETAYRVDAFAGAAASIGDGGPASQALMPGVRSVTADAKGGFYVADNFHSRIRYVDSSGIISTALSFADSVRTFGTSGYLLGSVMGMTVDPQGRLVFVDAAFCMIVRVEQNGTPKILAGSASGCGFSGDGGPATAAKIDPGFVTYGPDNSLYFTDTYNHRVRKIDAVSGVITTIAGTGAKTFGGENVPAVSAAIVYPRGLGFDSAGNLYVAEENFCRIRQITATGILRTFGGRCQGDSGDGGQVSAALFSDLLGLTVDATRNRLFVADVETNRIRMVDLNSGVVSAFVGSTSAPDDSFGGDGGPAASGRLSQPVTVAVDSTGRVLISDLRNGRIRSVTTGGVIQTVAGRWPVVNESSAATSAEFDGRNYGLTGNSLAADASGAVYLLDRYLLAVRKIDRNGTLTTFAGVPIDRLPAGTAYGVSTGDGSPARQAMFMLLDAIAVDGINNVYIADALSIRRIDSAGNIAKIATVSSRITGMRADANGRTLYFVHPGEETVYKLDLTTPGGSPAVFAGRTSSSGFAGDGGAATVAALHTPYDVALDATGRVLIADYNNDRLRRVGADGLISTIAGNGTSSFSREATALEGPALAVSIDPRGLAVGSDGTIFFAERAPGLRALDPTTGNIRLVAGTGLPGNSGDAGAAVAATFGSVDSVASDGQGNVFVMDSNDRIRVLRPLVVSAVSAVTGNNQSGTVGVALPSALSVRVLAGSIPVIGVTVDFRVTTGTATLSTSSARTDATGTALVRVTLGADPGPVVVTATVAGRPAITFNLTASAALNPNRPIIGAAGSVITAGAFGGGSTIAPGSWIEIYGMNLSATTKEWAGADFKANEAPTALEGVKVSIGGKPAFVRYVSPTQLNVQAPDGIAAGDTLIVTTAVGASEPIALTIATRAPGVLAPPTFKAGSVQYPAAFFPDGTFVGPADLIAGANFRPAKPGETIVFYGVGFGATSPASGAGQVVQGTANLPNVVVSVEGVGAQVAYAGLVANSVGLYQLNVVVPDVPPGNVDLLVSVAGIAAQKLTLAVAAK